MRRHVACLTRRRQATRDHHARHSPPPQSFRLRRDPVRTDVAGRGGNRQLSSRWCDALHQALDGVVADRVGCDAAGGAAGGTRDPRLLAAADAGGARLVNRRPA